ncbi:ABC transporter ATP-binding protein [Rhodobaculum claviforme]|uniref:Spermidine/putrescine import ATP-binding protein PotA n=1 Tax=Rhodobaculum claviforme TaxID=1549854 RepID=A0A934TMH7_9RHOB|nr:ABC transporter ATP-binding protein [Rhodobaculum claviforme]MBK5928835.1 polyamine ABC transporter ATP-binding protein [Rhodobaculum claviforme]
MRQTAPLAADTRPWRDAGATPFLRIQGVGKAFGMFTAVDDVTLDIHRGELFCLLGASGCGKSTLLRMLAGFETPSAGRILLDGQDMSAVPPHRRPTNMMFQSYALFPHMTVERNVMYGLLREGLGRAAARERAREMLRLVKLDGFGARKPHQLSGGQRQRVALARALVKQPKLLLLDEPLGALDKKLREETQFELVRIQETLGTTFIVVTHDQEEAMTIATRIGIMRDGRIVQVGEPREIYEAPDTRFVADFIGSVNLFEGRVDVAAGDGMRVVTQDLGPVTLRHVPGLTAGQTVWVALRPERLALGHSEPDTPNRFRALVEDVGYMGQLSVYRLRLPGGRLVQATLSSRAMDDAPISWDDEVWVSFAPAAGRVLTQ